MRGAAIASGLAFMVGAVIFVVMWLRGWLVVPIGHAGALVKERVMRIVKIGAPAGFEQLIFQVGFLAFLYIVSLYGTAPYAAYGIGVQLLSLSFVIGFGFSISGLRSLMATGFSTML